MDVIVFVLFVDSFVGYVDKNFFLSDSAVNCDFLCDVFVVLGFFDWIWGICFVVLEGIVFDVFVSVYAVENMGANAEFFSFMVHVYDVVWVVFLGVTWAMF